MKCYGAKSNGLCNNRQGRVLTADEYLNPQTVGDREFCKWRTGADCGFRAAQHVKKPMDAATRAMLEAGKELKCNQ